jgi:ribosomal protein S6
MNNKYKATFVLDTRGYDQSVETLIEKLTTLIASLDGKVESVDNMGVKEFVRTTDRKFVSGIFVALEVTGPSTLPAAVKEKLRRDRTVNRILIQAA